MRFLPAPADDDRDAAVLHRLGQRRGAGQPVVPAVEVERLAGRRAPQPGDDRQLLLVAVEPLPQRRERDAVGGVLGLEPARADAELDPAAAHLVDLRDRDRQRPGQPEGGRRHQRAQPDPAGLPGQPGEGHPGVGRSGQAVAAHRQVVVGPEEGVEAGLLGAPGDGEQVVVGGAHLGLGEDPQLHAPTLASAGRAAARRPLGVCSAAGPGRMIAETINSEVQLVFRKKTRGQVIGAELQEGFTHIGAAVTEAGRLAAEQLGPRVEAAREAAGPQLDAAQKAVAPKVAAAVAAAAPAVARPARPSAPGWRRPGTPSRPRVEAAREAAAPRVAAAQAAAAKAAADLAPRVEAAQKAAQKALKDDVVPRLEAAQVAALAYADPAGGRRPRRRRPRRWRAPARRWPPVSTAPAASSTPAAPSWPPARREVGAQGPQDGEEGAQDGRSRSTRVREEGRARPPSTVKRGAASRRSRAAGRGCSPPWRSGRRCSSSCAARSTTTGPPRPTGDGPVPSYREDPVPSSPAPPARPSPPPSTHRRLGPGRVRHGRAGDAQLVDGDGPTRRRRRHDAPSRSPPAAAPDDGPTAGPDDKPV